MESVRSFFSAVKDIFVPSIFRSNKGRATKLARRGNRYGSDTLEKRTPAPSTIQSETSRSVGPLPANFRNTLPHEVEALRAKLVGGTNAEVARMDRMDVDTAIAAEAERVSERLGGTRTALSPEALAALGEPQRADLAARVRTWQSSSAGSFSEPLAHEFETARRAAVPPTPPPPRKAGRSLRAPVAPTEKEAAVHVRLAEAASQREHGSADLSDDEIAERLTGNEAQYRSLTDSQVARGLARLDAAADPRIARDQASIAREIGRAAPQAEPHDFHLNAQGFAAAPETESVELTQAEREAFAANFPEIPL